ncbi:MAG: aspartate--tRNA ligase [Candidatus Woesearchaeota archaeon]
MNTKLRTHNCGELRKTDIGKEVRLSGWVNSYRDHGGKIFIDLRDKFGITQIVFDPSNNKESHKIAETLRREFIIHVKGIVRYRGEGLENKNLETGEIEVLVNEVDILNKAETPPFEIDDRIEVSEEIRLKYRFLDLRRRRLQQNIIFRSHVVKFIRDWMFSRGFTEIETPILTVSSPEGARDFLVPSRLHPGKFYALPQAPQQYKQLLMVAGFDKYFQIAPCMRDEDARADRSPGEFYQLDCETSFLSQDEFFDLMEPLFIELSEKFTNKKILQKPFPRLKYKDVMLKYGTDKPDIRFGLEIQDITEIVKETNFEVFSNIIKNNGIVRAINAKNSANVFTRKDIEELTEIAKGHGLKGLAYITLKDNEIKSPITKYLGEEITKNIIKEMSAVEGDIIFFAAEKEKIVCKALSQVRLELGKRLKLIDENVLAWLWVVDFPMYEYNEEEGKIDFCHNPFSMPQGGLEALKNKDPLDILAYQYDIVCNGIELSSGAVRNNIPEIMYKAFEIAGYGNEVVDKKFGHMIKAFKFGAPPHCGFAPGIERLVMILRGEPNIREMTAFPKNKNAEELMVGSPSEVDEKQLKELHIKLDFIKKEQLKK